MLQETIVGGLQTRVLAMLDLQHVAQSHIDEIYFPKL